MIVDPWGLVMNELATGSGLVCADPSLTRLRNIRRTFPCLDHRNIVCRV
jgi:nitrilase